MSSKDPTKRPQAPSREERLAKALRENLGRRKALARTRRDQDQGKSLSGRAAGAGDDSQDDAAS